MTDQKAIEAARQINAAIKSMAGKPIPISFPNDEVAMLVTSIIKNAGIVARALLAIPSAAAKGEREKVLEEAAKAVDKLHFRGATGSIYFTCKIADAANAIRALSTPDTEGDDSEDNSAAAAAAPRPSAAGWLPMASAPKDGSFLLTNDLGEVCPCQSRQGERIVSNMPGFADWTWGSIATGWMPLPAAQGKRIEAMAEGDVRADERRKCWQRINAMIVPGELGGNGCDRLAQRGGLILAANALLEIMEQEGASESEEQGAESAANERANRLIQRLCNAAKESPGCIWPACDCGTR